MAHPSAAAQPTRPLLSACRWTAEDSHAYARGDKILPQHLKEAIREHVAYAAPAPERRKDLSLHRRMTGLEGTK